MRNFFIAACLLFSLSSSVPLFAQPASSTLFPAVDCPRDYFRNPLAVPISLAANFGELRPNHYHMGLDIRTRHRENLPVFAAADGYVARVQIEPAGFGQAIYIRHPNGYTTVYGHLNQFFPALAAYISEQQYKRESWQIDLEIPAALFPVKKGDLIAYSGNTGGSQGPHLHFEIRRTAGDVNQNPLLFGLPVPDNTAPAFVRLAWYDRNQGIYEQSPHILPVRKEAGTATSAHNTLSKTQDDRVTVAWTIVPSLLMVTASRISFAISAFDTQSGSANPNGIYEALLYKDDQPLIGFRMNDISYDNTRNLNAHIDYRTRATGGPFLQHLSLLPGYPPPTIYASPADRPSNGVIDLGDGQAHLIRIGIKDTYGNSSALSFRVQYRPLTVTAGPGAASPGPVAATAAIPAPEGSLAPDTSRQEAAGKRFYPGMIDGIELSYCAFYLGEKSLYDSVLVKAYVNYSPKLYPAPTRAISNAYTIGAPWIPLLEPVLVRLQPTHAYDVDSLIGAGWVSQRDHIVMVRTSGGQKEVQRVQWKDDWASARFREFGDFQLVEDNTAPVIIPLEPLEGTAPGKAARIAFSIKDDLGALRKFRAELDGAWLCFTNDKGLAYIYKFDNHCPPGAHTLKVSVEDVAGNRTEKLYHFTR